MSGHVAARPWTVNLYVVLVAALIALVWGKTGWASAWPLLFHFLLAAGVWIGNRLAWAFGVALYALAGFAAATSFRGARGAPLLLFAVWLGLLLAPPTRRWIDRRRRVPASLGAS